MRENVIFALTRHGGHLGYFEGGVVLPNSVTWLDRVIVEFGIALLSCRTTSDRTQPPLKLHTAVNSFKNGDVLARKSTSTENYSSDDDDDDDLTPKRDIPRPSTLSKRQPEDELAAEMVAEILHTSASMVYGT